MDHSNRTNQQPDGEQIEVGELDNTVLTLTTGYQTGQPTHEQLDMHYTDVENETNNILEDHI